jgi:hypothetical protein
MFLWLLKKSNLFGKKLRRPSLRFIYYNINIRFVNLYYGF